MDVKLPEYIVASEKYGSITAAAEKLFITPSALNQQLIKLEKELQLQLFTRARRRMFPTQAGRIYIDAAKQAIALKQSTYSQLQDLAECVVGTYHLGLTYDHGSDVFARIYPRFHARYPNVQIVCQQLLVPELLDMLVSNELDLTFVLGVNLSKYDDMSYIPISSENLLLGVPRCHPMAREVPLERCPCAVADLKSFERDSFAMALSRSTMRSELIDPIFKETGYSPSIIMESNFNSFLEQLTVQGICNTIIPQSFARNHTDAAWFYLPGFPRFNFGVMHLKSYCLNNALKYFITLAEEDAMLHLQYDPPPRCPAGIP